MENIENIADKLLQDEVVLFISSRHHATPRDVLNSFAMRMDGECHMHDSQPVDLEENEIQIICDLIQMYHQ